MHAHDMRAHIKPLQSYKKYCKFANIYAIFFIWDEFTEYFQNNPHNITGLQEIAMASSEIGFYFFMETTILNGQNLKMEIVEVAILVTQEMQIQL